MCFNETYPNRIARQNETKSKQSQLPSPRAPTTIKTQQTINANPTTYIVQNVLKPSMSNSNHNPMYMLEPKFVPQFHPHLHYRQANPNVNVNVNVNKYHSPLINIQYLQNVEHSQ